MASLQDQYPHLPDDMVALDGLNIDVLLEIIHIIHDSSRYSLFSLLRVNKTFHDLTLPFLYRVLDFDITQADHRCLRKALHDPYTRSRHRIRSMMEENPMVLKATRKLIVRSAYARWPGDTLHRTTFIPSDEDIQAKWSLFVEFISRINNLQDLVFDCRERVPLILLDVLHSRHPSCQLHVRNWTRAGCDVRVGDPYEEALARSPCLRSMEAFIIPGPPSADLTSPAFSRILSLAPNLQSVGYNTSSSQGWQYAFNRMTAEQIEEIRMESERFEVKQPVRKGLKSIRWPSIDEDVLKRCEESGLGVETVVSLDMGEVFRIPESIQGTKGRYSTALKHLTFTLHRSLRSDSEKKELKSKIIDFLLCIPPLQSLSVTNYSSLVDISTLLDRHGGSLRSLSLHEVECSHEPRPVHSVEQLKDLRERAPQLEELGLDINRTADAVKESACYDVLGSFPQLYRLNIYYDLALHFYSPNLAPDNHYSNKYSRMDEEFGRSVWKAIQTAKQKYGYAYRGIEEMTLVAGEQRHFERRVSMFPVGRSSGQTLILRRNERDDRRDELHISRVTPLER
ncbi:hypothetical protein L218DRAFT_1081964 [Marasmius fiardii PR-910]|nr:hypothetical protein L218DRAFT_1081964 [Marasmius fiardii PR-910]